MTPEESDPWKPDLGDRTSNLKPLKVGSAPAPIIARAEQLCDLVDEADGIRPDRQTLIAALVFDAVPDGEELAKIWRAYRVASVYEVLLGRFPDSGEVDLSGYKKR